MSKVTCFACGTDLPILGNVGFREECYKCHADVHVCKTCVHYDSKAYNECREPQADVVREKERANFCEYYLPTVKGAAQGPTKTDLLAAAEALFKKKT